MIVVDTREKPDAIKRILAEFERAGEPYIRTKAYVGDYYKYDNPLLIIDRKQNLQEVAQNCTSGHDRFKRELIRLKDINGFMYILVEQDKIDGKPIESIDDVMFWSNKYGEVEGYRIYKIMHAWEHKYPIKYVFCNKRNTGKEILRLLGGGSDGER